MNTVNTINVGDIIRVTGGGTARNWGVRYGVVTKITKTQITLDLPPCRADSRHGLTRFSRKDGKQLGAANAACYWRIEGIDL